MSIPNYTVIIAIDRQHASELATVLPTWQRFRPDVSGRPLMLIADDDSGLDCSAIGRAWPGPFSVRWFSGLQNLPQRDRMLTALTVLPPHLVKTPYWLKLDTDVIATGPGTFDPAWFDGDPALVASPWGYSKPPGSLAALNIWAWGVEQDGHRWPTGPIDGTVDGDRVRHPRWISWLSFLRTDWTRQALSLVGDTPEQQMARLPVRSHDGFYSYVAQRMGAPCRSVRFKRHGWDHVRAKRLPQRVREVLEAQHERG